MKNHSNECGTISGCISRMLDRNLKEGENTKSGETKSRRKAGKRIGANRLDAGKVFISFIGNPDIFVGRRIQVVINDS